MAQKSYKGKKQYPTYKSENRVLKNKILKLEKHCKNFPEDEKAQKELERVKKGKIKLRDKVQVRYKNKVNVIVKPGEVPERAPKTAGEQLARLLGIELPKSRKKRKPKITKKRQKRVNQS